MSNYTASAIAHPNIAFIKYWGNRDDALHLPANGSLSMCLDGLTTHTRVSFDPNLTQDGLTLDGLPIQGEGRARVQAFLDHVRTLSKQNIYAQVESDNNFPSGAGMASSASAFAALSLAATTALGLQLSERELSRLARLGSGSACRSIPAGFVEWQAGESDADSYAFSIAPPNYWDLADCIVILDSSHKAIGSAEGMTLAHTSPLQAERVRAAPERLRLCQEAILSREFDAFAKVVEQDSALMHEVMRTSTPALVYMQPETNRIIDEVRNWRTVGHAVCTTVDAGPNVHILCLKHELDFIHHQLQNMPGVHQVLTALPGKGAHILPV